MIEMLSLGWDAMPLMSRTPLLSSSSDGSGAAWMAGAIVGAVLVGVAAYYVHRAIQKSKQNSHPELFRGLCQVHGIEGARRRLLKQVARLHNMDKPALLFVEPKWIQAASRSAVLRERTDELRELQEALFGRLDRI